MAISVNILQPLRMQKKTSGPTSSRHGMRSIRPSNLRSEKSWRRRKSPIKQRMIDSVKKTNAEEVAKRGRRKAAIQPHPATSERLNELRARAADRGVEPFRAWLASIKAVKGVPRRVQLPWVLWQDASHGEALRARYREAYKKEADDEEKRGAFSIRLRRTATKTYFDELTEEEQERVREKREEEYAARLAAHNRLMQASPRQHVLADAVQRVVLLGEIVDGDSDEIFLSMVQQGAMPRPSGGRFHDVGPGSLQGRAASLRRLPGRVQKEEKGVLGPLTDPGPPAPHAAALCTRRLSSPSAAGTAAPVVSGAIAEKTSQQKAGKKAGKKAKRRRGEEEPEAEESGAEDDEGEWPGGGNSLAAMAMPERNHRIHTLNALSDAEYDRENNVARNKDLFRRLFPVDPVVELGLRAPPSNEPPPSSKPRRAASPPEQRTPAPADRSSQHLANATGQAQVADPGSDGVMPIDAPMAASSAEDEPTRPSQRLASAAPGAGRGLGQRRSDAGKLSRGRGRPGLCSRGCERDDRGAGSSGQGRGRNGRAWPSGRSGSGINLPAWGAVVDAWCALERATGLQVPGKALPAYGRPEATVNWWIAVNPAWRKEGVTGPASFVERGLKQESGGDLEGLPAGLNGLTTCWGGGGAPRWKKLADDVTWVLTEKSRAFGHKRAVAPSGDEPAGKRARLG
ncbi:hypothetical protein B0H14DRAFT_2603499 [Mycena olivaceomarginata]|nr:hypothetical protein B0H14DRAFT_2603499 [Mycena olivaceomarginata]